MPSGHGAPGKSPSESGGHVQSAHIELFTPSRWSLFRQAGVRARVVHHRRGVLRLLGEKHRERQKHHAPHTCSLSSRSNAAGEGVIQLVGIFETLKKIGWEGIVSPLQF